MSSGRPTITLDDLADHVIRFGMDVFPPLELAREQAKAHTLFQEAKEAYPDICAGLTLSDVEFKISRVLSAPGGKASFDTLVWTPRGPVIRLPVRLQAIQAGDICTEAECMGVFSELRAVMLRSIPGLQILRVGLVRELVFSTGETPCTSLLPCPAEFGGAKLIGGTFLSVFADETYNMRISYEPAETHEFAKIPASGQVAKRWKSFALKVDFDVYNLELRPLDDADIDRVIERATSLWPAPLIRYLNRREFE